MLFVKWTGKFLQIFYQLHFRLVQVTLLIWYEIICPEGRYGRPTETSPAILKKNVMPIVGFAFRYGSSIVNSNVNEPIINSDQKGGHNYRDIVEVITFWYLLKKQLNVIFW